LGAEWGGGNDDQGDESSTGHDFSVPDPSAEMLNAVKNDPRRPRTATARITPASFPGKRPITARSASAQTL
jgi:hypothetical protein